MEMNVYTGSLLIFLIALIGGIWGAFTKTSGETLHLVLSLAAGFFLGAVFFELLPLSFQSAGAEQFRTVGALTLVGFTFIYIVEKGIVPLALPHSAGDGHGVVAYTALFGLSVHSVSEGIALILGAEDSAHSGVFLSIAAHKGVASLALGSLFALAHFSLRQICFNILIFALMTPLGALGAQAFLSSGTLLDHAVFSYLAAATAGVFLYVATADILPEVMHSRVSIGWKLLLLSAGMVIMWSLGSYAH